MARLSNDFMNMLEYLGVRLRDQKHPLHPISYDPEDLMPYYLDQRWFAGFEGPFDNRGAPVFCIGTRTYRMPVHTCLYALGHLDLFNSGRSDENLNQFKLSVNSLVEDQTEDGSWLSTLPKQKFGLARPWPSAMAQGLAISCLVRAFRLFGDDRYRDAALRALKPFHREIREGGVTTYHEEGAFYEEYPCYPHRHVLNGFLFAMWGLMDLARFENNNEAKLLWENGLATFVKWLPRYDTGYWSLYQLPERPMNPATVAYHRLHINQLGVMYAITGEKTFNDFRNRWLGYLESPLNALRTLPAKLRWLM